MRGCLPDTQHDRPCRVRRDCDLGFTSVDARFGQLGRGVAVAPVGRNLMESTQRNAVTLNKDEVILPG